MSISTLQGTVKCLRLYRMSEYSGFILVNKNTLGPKFFVGCHRISENSGDGLHMFHCIFIALMYSDHGGQSCTVSNKTSSKI